MIRCWPDILISGSLPAPTSFLPDWWQLFLIIENTKTSSLILYCLHDLPVRQYGNHSPSVRYGQVYPGSRCCTVQEGPTRGTAYDPERILTVVLRSQCLTSFGNGNIHRYADLESKTIRLAMWNGSQRERHASLKPDAYLCEAMKTIIPNHLRRKSKPDGHQHNATYF